MALRTKTLTKSIVATMVIGIALGTFFFAHGYTVRVNNGLAIPLAAWWVAIPLMIYRECKTIWCSILAGAGLVAAEVIALVVVYTDSHSTAAIGLLGHPLLLALAMAGAIIAEDLLTSGFARRARSQEQRIGE
jgi:hypothetical protein